MYTGRFIDCRLVNFTVSLALDAILMGGESYCEFLYIMVNLMVF